MWCTVIAVVPWPCYFLNENVWMSWCEDHYLVSRFFYTQFLQCFYFFLLSLSYSVFSPSLSCTHERPGSVGVWTMTHLLHTPHHCLTIFGLPGNPFFCCCVVEEPALQRKHDELFSTYSFLLYYSARSLNLSTEVSSSRQTLCEYFLCPFFQCASWELMNAHYNIVLKYCSSHLIYSCTCDTL